MKSEREINKEKVEKMILRDNDVEMISLLNDNFYLDYTVFEVLSAVENSVDFSDVDLIEKIEIIEQETYCYIKKEKYAIFEIKFDYNNMMISRFVFMKE